MGSSPSLFKEPGHQLLESVSLTQLTGLPLHLSEITRHSSNILKLSLSSSEFNLSFFDPRTIVLNAAQHPKTPW